MRKFESKTSVWLIDEGAGIFCRLPRAEGPHPNEGWQPAVSYTTGWREFRDLTVVDGMLLKLTPIDEWGDAIGVMKTAAKESPPSWCAS